LGSPGNNEDPFKDGGIGFQPVQYCTRQDAWPPNISFGAAADFSGSSLANNLGFKAELWNQ
jgi:hypothetical protein